MPSITFQIPDLKSVGPVVEVTLAPAKELLEELAKKGIKPPPPVKALAMIDTGASSSVIRPDLIAQLGVCPIGKVKITTPSDVGVECLQYQAVVVFPNNVAVDSSEIIAAPLQGQHIQCLIGRDILRHGVLVYIGYAQSITLSF